jgi:hypothetical protein
MLQRLPKIIGWSEFRALGFYDFYSLDQCLLKAMPFSKTLQIDISFPPTPPTKTILVGQFYHRLNELLSVKKTKSDFLDAAEVEIDSLQKQVNQWPQHSKLGSVSGWKEVNLAVIKTVKFYSESKPKTNVDRVLGVEKTLSSKNGYFSGRPDFFIILGDIAILKEYKSSSIWNEKGEVRQEYLEQLRFYSMLLFDNFKIQSVSASLISLNGSEYDVNFERAPIEEYLDLATNKVVEANGILKKSRHSRQLAKPSKDSCQYCIKRSICSKFKVTQFEIGLTTDEFVIDGNITEIITANATSTICVKNSQFSKEMTIIIPVKYSTDLSIGENVCFTDLSFHRFELRWSNKSRIFSTCPE